MQSMLIIRFKYSNVCMSVEWIDFITFFKKYNFVYLLTTVLGLLCCLWAFSSSGARGLLSSCELLIAVASLAAETGSVACGLQ